MEGGTFLDERIQKAFSRFVEIRVHTDHNDKKLRYQGKTLQRERFKTLAVPYYVVLDPSGETVYWRKGGVMSEDDFLAGIENAPAEQDTKK